MSDIPVVIFCGGKGTRMQGGTLTKKELVPIGGRPILWHVMRIFSAYGFNQFILPLGYEANQIKRYFLQYDANQLDLTVRLDAALPQVTYHGALDHDPWEVSLIDTGIEVSKANRLGRVADYLKGDRFFVTYGDGVADIDLPALVRFHLAHGKLGTLTAVQSHYQYGVLQANEAGIVEDYVLKPRLPHWINAGFMLFEKAALEWIAGNAENDFDADIFTPLVPKRELARYRHSGFWHSMDTLKDTHTLEQLWQKSAPWRVW